MDEKRKFFRIINKGEISGKIAGRPVEVIDISASGVALVKVELVPEQGTIELTINHTMIALYFKILRITQDKTILTFNDEEHIDQLLRVLKTLRNDRKNKG